MKINQPTDLFSHIKFPEYKFQEYPKWVNDKDGKSVVVHTRDEEASVVAPPAGESPGEVSAEDTFSVEAGEENEDEPEETQEPSEDDDRDDDDEKEDNAPSGGDDDAKKVAARERAKARRAAKRKAAEAKAAVAKKKR